MSNESFLAAEFSNRWKKFRETLLREDRLVWDEMWKVAEKQSMAMMIEKRKIDNEFEKKLDDLKKRMAALERKMQSDS